MKQITRDEAINELKRLSSKTPAELWDEFPERKKFEEKIVVDYANVKNDPLSVYNQFVNYIQVPKRKPWVLDKICKRLNTQLSDPANTIVEINPNNDENILENY